MSNHSIAACPASRFSFKLRLIRQAPALVLAFAAAWLVPAAPLKAQTVEVAGAKFPPTVQVARTPLKLNGAGIRYKVVFKVYAAGLYLTEKAATPDAVIDMPGPKRLQVVMLRDIDANELGRLFARGMEENSSSADFVKTIPGTIRMADIFAARGRLTVGDAFSVDWLPGVGTVVVVNGTPQGEPIKDPEFFRAMMRIWLGQHPADSQLKEALLGRAPPSSTAMNGSMK
jgi:hypothetical protein